MNLQAEAEKLESINVQIRTAKNGLPRMATHYPDRESQVRYFHSAKKKTKDGVRPNTKSLPNLCRPLRILHVLNSLGRGGTELGTLKVMAGLSSDLFEQGLCVIRGFNPDLASLPFLKDKLFSAGEEHNERQFSLFRLVRTIKRFQPDIVHSRNWGTIEALAAARLSGAPVAIHSEHGYEVDTLDGLPQRRRILRRGFYLFADTVFTVTNDLRRYHARQVWWSPEKIRVIHNGVDTRLFAPRPQDRLRLRSEFGLPQDGFVIGTAGRLAPIKDLPTLLRAAESLLSNGANLQLVLMGSGPEQAHLEETVKSSANLRGRVLFIDAADHVHDLLNAIDAFVLPSLCEGMPNSLLEAMATGLPVVATRVGGNPEVVEDGRSGWLFSPKDVSALAEHLRALAGSEDLRLQLGAAARERTVKEFSIERMMKDYENLYLELAERRGLRIGQ